jgi:hypothetical protein
MSTKPKSFYFRSNSYVSFSSANVSVDLKQFLATKEGKDTIRNAAKKVSSSALNPRAGTEKRTDTEKMQKVAPRKLEPESA